MRARHMPNRSKKGSRRRAFTKASPVTVYDASTGELLGEHAAYNPWQLNRVIAGKPPNKVRGPATP